MDISLLRERRDSAFTVTELNTYIKNMFEGNRTLSAVTVRGEISNFISHRSGHMYFSLKDGEAQVKAVMFRSRASGLKFMPENGMKVIVHGSVTVYSQGGSYQIYANSMQPDGVGALYLAYEQLKERLSLEGLFDENHKKAIPGMPDSIGIVTSTEGAAVRDIINVTGRRFPMAKLYIYPALVQGEQAEQSLVKGIDYFDRSGLVDLVIIGRGGGSIEDLWAFNGETLARRIYDARVPIISAVGHETDFTICDFVADMRAPTPSAAAELSVPDKNELVHYLDYCLDRCDRAVENKIAFARERLNSFKDSLMLRDVASIVDDKRLGVKVLLDRARETVRHGFERSRAMLTASVGKLEALNPLSVLTRGYGIVTSGGVTITDSADVACGDVLDITLLNGKISAVVTEKKEKNNVADKNI